MNLKFLSVIFLVFILGCKTKESPVAPITGIQLPADPPQYGTPFGAVPDPRNVVIYQVNLRIFSQEGNFAGVTQRLDSIKALGANVVYLMPIYPIGKLKGINSPYCIQDYDDINPEFGNLSDLRTLVDKAHEKGMAVILDWVANHTAWDNEWITAHKSWYLIQNGEVVSPPNMGWNDVAQLNFNNFDMRKSMIKAMKHWVLAANVDGFRCDYADGPPVAFWKQAIDTLRNIKSHKLLIMGEGGRQENFSAGFNFNFGFNFFHTLKTAYASGGNATSFDAVNTQEYQSASPSQFVVRYTSNHDVNGSDGTPLELFGGNKGALGAFVIAAYMKGVPMIYGGQEVGTAQRITFPWISPKIDWNGNPEVKAAYKKIIAFRNSSAAVRNGNLTSNFSNADVCAFQKEIDSEKVLILVNLRNKSVDFSLPGNVANSNWLNTLSGEKMVLKSSIALKAYDYLILKNDI